MTPTAWLKAQTPLAGRALPVAIVLQGLNGALLIAQAWLLALILNAVTFAHAGLAEVRPWLWQLLALFAARALTAWGAERFAVRGSARIKVALRDRVYRRLQARGPAYLAGERSGALVETLTKGVDDLDAYYARFLPARALAMTLPFAILLLVWPLDWVSGLVLLVTAPLIPLFMTLIGRNAERLNQRQWKELARMGARFLDSIQGLTTLKLFGASRRQGTELAAVSEAYRVGTMRVLRVAFLSSAVLEFFATISIAVVAVLIGFRLYGFEVPLPAWISLPRIDFQTGFFVLLLAPEFFLPLRSLGTHYHGRMEATAAAERLIEVLGPEPQTASTDATAAPAGPRTAPGPVTLRFTDVHFSYSEGREALCGLSLEIQPGERLALVGTSGAGKTTLVQLLLGFLTPTAGTLTVNGRDLRTLDLDDWHRHLAWVPQQPRLFQGTIGANIRLGIPPDDSRTHPDAVRTAALLARAAGFIESLPAGYETPVGERGAGLSGGQIQRIALARAFLRDAPLVILDEATANLDPESERLVQEGIDELARGRTLIAIAHRLDTVRKADRILVLDQGRMVESGDHTTLLAQDGAYRRLLHAYAGQGRLGGAA
ncbi:MAG: thiol reductant ABC exporter subunit CydD [Lamprocystis purpurea]|jgi:ATP-binding cassette subfamily C protein CydD|uniref:thiol reductant ABC exporter subunit CydD n=1 Tax=Lamprocystis purpurea TaxID=61598 RepID=UPI00035CC1A7|nr:thiol reductant ABC exporter subunit CydD [Lamprocystis purpurea]MBV5273050.1 thiol reductant ABC exporter subunit CydD [Lamprocystis purpurea]